MEKLFKLKEHNTTVKTEVMAGITTFLTMYLLPLLWQHLSEHCSWQSLQTIHLHWHLVWD